MVHNASLRCGNGQRNSCGTLPHCLGAVGSGSPTVYRHTAFGRWALDLLQHTAALPRGSGLWNFCNALPHCLGVVGSGAPTTHFCTTEAGAPGYGPLVAHGRSAWGQWAVGIVQYIVGQRGRR